MNAFVKFLLSDLWRGIKGARILVWLSLVVFLAGMLWLLICWQPASAGASRPTSTPSHRCTATPMVSPTPWMMYVPDVRTDCPEGIMCITEVTE